MYSFQIHNTRPAFDFFWKSFGFYIGNKDWNLKLLSCMGLRFAAFWDEREGADSQQPAASIAHHDWGNET